MPPHRLLVVEDDADLRSVLRRGLSEEGFAVTAVADGASALAAAGDEPHALVIDIGLPDADGRDVCQALRARGTTAPVLFLTARDALTDRLSGFSAGGDDYLTKPFHLAELVARLRALLRRAGADEAVEVGPGLRLDPAAHALRNGDAEVLLTPTEFRLLAALAARPGTVLRRAELVRAAWPEGAIVHDNTLDQYVARLRRKLREADRDDAIVTVHGVGYRLAARPATIDPK
jgi:two-component system response regulator MprA